MKDLCNSICKAPGDRDLGDSYQLVSATLETAKRKSGDPSKHLSEVDTIKPDGHGGNSTPDRNGKKGYTS